MGDRGNIVVSKQGDGTMHFYTHWSGSELPQTVADGLDRGRSRWDDYIYLNRVLFCEMIKDDVLSETGFGLSIEMGDGGTEIYVDHDAQEVTYNGTCLTFEDFVANHKSKETS